MSLNDHILAASLRPSYRERFWAKFTLVDGDGCWTIPGNNGDYASASISVPWSKKGRSVGAHRIAWTIVNGRIPDGMCVLHRCDNPPCVRPDHLFIGTVLDNKRDEVAKERNVKGERIVQSKITARDVRLIRAIGRRVPSKILAEWFGVTRVNINYILNRTWWKHVT